MTAPRIGITTYAPYLHEQEENFRVPCDYVDAVHMAKGIPILLPMGEPYTEELVDMIDGLLLVGGGDICPAEYGGPEHETIYETDERRDRFEMALVIESLEARIPLLGICRGIQVLNVALGGTLHAHLPDVVGETVKHKPEPSSAIEHDLSVTPGSRLAEVMGQLEFSANSDHHQAIKDIASGLAVVGEAPDGVIEAVEMPDHPWLVAVQWHPERTAAEDPVQQRLFDQFVLASTSPSQE
jgi:putative glutamine amidotransferase